MVTPASSPRKLVGPARGYQSPARESDDQSAATFSKASTASCSIPSTSAKHSGPGEGSSSVEMTPANQSGGAVNASVAPAGFTRTCFTPLSVKISRFAAQMQGRRE